MSYLVRVQKFFIKHDPDRLYLAKRIARSFRQDEEAVMKRLEEIYAKGGPKKLKVKEISKVVKKENPTPNEVTEEIVNDDVNSTVKDVKPKKSKKKLFITLGLVLVIAGGGAGFYMTMGDSSSHDSTTHDSETHSSDSTHEENSAKTEDEVDKAIEQAEKDSVTKELIEVGGAALKVLR